MTGIVVAAIAAVQTILVAVLATRTQRVEAKVADRAAELEGYDELTAHLRGYNAELINQNSVLAGLHFRGREAHRRLRDDYSTLWHAWPADLTRPETCDPPDHHRWEEDL